MNDLTNAISNASTLDRSQGQSYLLAKQQVNKDFVKLKKEYDVLYQDIRKIEDRNDNLLENYKIL